MEIQNLEEHLELLIDKHGIKEIVDSITSVCDEKIEHIKTHYPEDKSLVREWQRISNKLHITSNAIDFAWN